jgi:hypothetical protein
MSRAPPCSPHGLSPEGNGSRSALPGRMKSLIGEYLGQSSVFVGKKTKGGLGWRRSRPTVIIGQMQRGGEHGGNTNGIYHTHIIC